MTDRTNPLSPATSDPARPTTHQDDSLQEETAPLKQHGDALRDPSGSRQGKSLPNAGTEPRAGR